MPGRLGASPYAPLPAAAPVLCWGSMRWQQLHVRFGSNAERLVLSISRLLRSHTGHAADGTPPPNPRYCGRGFLKQFKPLAAHGKLEDVEPGHVAAGPGKVGDEALADRTVTCTNRRTVVILHNRT